MSVSKVPAFVELLRRTSELCTSSHICINNVPVSSKELLQSALVAETRHPPSATVTCCIAFGNDHAFLGSALDSISRQSAPIERILIGVDSCRDQFSYRYHLNGTPTEHWHFMGDHGPFVIMDKLVRNTTSEYVLLLDSDDIAHPDRLAVLLATAISTRSDFVGSASVNVDEEGSHAISADVFPQFPRSALSRNMCHAALYPTILLRRTAFIELDGFAKFESFGMDSEFIQRASKRFRFQNVPLPLYLKRNRSGSLTNRAETGSRSERRRRVMEFTRRRYMEVFDGPG